MGWVGGMVILRAGSGRNESGNPKLTSWRSGHPASGAVRTQWDDEILTIMNQEQDGNPVIPLRGYLDNDQWEEDESTG